MFIVLCTHRVNLKQTTRDSSIQQEGIPVECVLPAFLIPAGLPAYTHLDRDPPPGQRPLDKDPRTETPLYHSEQND